MKQLETTCIVCPNSCRLKVQEADGIITVTGNECKLGEKYGTDELTAPRRMLSTTIRIENAAHRLLPVVSAEAILKSDMQKCLDDLYGLTVSAPVKEGEIICKDLCGTGVTIVAGRTMEANYASLNGGDEWTRNN